MNKLLVCLAAGAVAAGCTSVPKPALPDGSERSPLNSAAKIEAYQAKVAQEAAAQAAEKAVQSALGREVQTLNRQVADLKALLAIMGMERGDPTRAQPSAVAAAQGVSGKGEVRVGDERTETVEPQGKSLVFRITHPFANTDFKVSEPTRDELLRAARMSSFIEIRGRTDAKFDNPVDRDIALQRALKARRFLVDAGIEPNKISISSRAAGGHVADNSTAAGRALNRRVEVETADVSLSAIKAVQTAARND